MHTRRILLAFSLAASAATVASADLVEVNSNTQIDPIEELTHTIAKGSYSQPEDIDIPARTKVSVTLREKSVELNNQSLAKKYSSNTSTRYTANGISSWLIAHPLPSARVSSTYGGRVMGGKAENHSGLDLAAPSGTPIYATGPGVVTKSGWGNGYGQYVEINHGNGYLTRYAHASRLLVSVGERVNAGDQIANVGCTGRCTGPHLHYEVVKDGQRKNPATYLAMLP
ncbi:MULTISPECIES: M23 family metallopeptidase [unclassified Acinetobacter]|uniref:M23 family metallopeptidase n=1 Tax=unclassified Acinetobacter TaxID=196816 RepID=UPI002362DE59|nr:MULTISPECIES: M23 family metallopeptidase [unclassified Acinetobacter]